MERIAYFFDGFNIYFSLKFRNYNKYKWLNYYKLAEVLTPQSKQIVSVNYFSAYQSWKLEKYKRHKKYVMALRVHKINVKLGKYKKVSRQCKICGKISNNYHIEKQTDVNIAVSILKGALLDEYDTAVLATADTDLLAPIREIHNIPNPKKIGILFPIDRNSNELRNEADFCIQLKEKHLSSCQLPDEIVIGNQIIHRPAEWR